MDEPFDELPETLRPSTVRAQTMQTVGVWMTLGGCFLLAVAVAWWLGSVHDVASVGGREYHLSSAVVGGVLLLHGLVAVVVTDSL